jgi:IS30 family transposase
MCHYIHFPTEERKISRVMKKQGMSIRKIARNLKAFTVLELVLIDD